MSLIINTNLSSLNAQRFMLRANNDMSTAMERLSSGRQINTAADDAAGLALSNRMTSQIRGLAQAVRNANDGISMIQTAEGALDESTNILQRMRELAIQSSNGIYSDTDRATLDAEAQQLSAELDRIAQTTSFNGRKILDGSAGAVNLQVGANANQTIDFSIAAVDTATLGLDTGLSGSFVGNTINLDSNGRLASGLDFAALRINDQTVSGVADGGSVQDLLTRLNDLDGLSASTITTLNADTVGSGVLSGGDQMTLTGTNLNGGSFSLTIENTESLQDIVEQINTRGGDNYIASIGDDGRLSVSGERMARISISDDTGGIASGMDVSTIADPAVAATINGLTSYWIREAETLIETYFDITGNANGLVDLTLNLADSDGVGGNLASVSFLIGGGVNDLGSNLTLNIDLADFTDENQPNGGSSPYFNDRVIAHEIVHAVMARNMNPSLLPGWFTEGTAELIQGADERVKGDFAALDTTPELTAAFKTDPGSPATSAGYSAGYLATKFLQDDIYAASGGANGINLVFDELESGATLDSALSTVATNLSITDWTDLNSFESFFLANGVSYLNEGYVNGTFDLDAGTELDTGSIAGSDYGNAALNETDVLPNNAVGAAQDFNLVIPDEFAGTSKVASAQLVIVSDNNDAISIGLGANGTDADLRALGLMVTAVDGSTTGAELSVSDQSLAINAGDLIINDVTIEGVASAAGLLSKVEAINNASDRTGVRAAITSTVSFTYNDAVTTEFRTNVGPISVSAGDAGLLGLNGIGITVNTGDTADDIAASINAVTFAHGVTAYADDSGNLHVSSEQNINVGAAPGSLFTNLGFVNTGATQTGSLTLNSAEVALTDLTDLTVIVNDINNLQSTTGVAASIDQNGKLQFESSRAMTFELGDTNGLQTFRTLGIDFSTEDTANTGLVDSDGDYRLHDEIYTVGPRITLDALNNQPISIQTTINGEDATGLTSVNAGDAIGGGNAISSLSIATSAGAQRAIASIDNALETINDNRAQLGAVNNRLGFTVSNLMNIGENTSAARSRIVDADYAKETANLTRADVSRQAAQAMLAQANARPAQVLQLLQ